MTGDYRAGSQIGDYVLDSYLGGGSFGAVWRGHHSTDGSIAAVKLLTGNLSASENAAMRADVELLAAAAASSSDHVVKVLGGGTDPVPYIVMEFIEGHTLQELLDGGGALPIDECIKVGFAICDALRALHAVGVVHRDIKPANVMTDTTGLTKLTDFGIAKIVGFKTLTMTGQTAMTMAYAAPELWDEDGKYGRPSHRSDIYAMAVLLYQCLTGSTPFIGNYGALYRAHTERIPDLQILPSGTPPSLRIMIARSMEKRQADRPEDASECLALLRRAQVEIADLRGQPNREPVRFGPWLKERPHETVPWAWHGKHDQTAEDATIEIHFAASLDYGARINDAISANSGLAVLGAERLIDSNRLLLRPGEEWREAPPGQFQFWVARADLPVIEAAQVTEELLPRAVGDLASLIEVAEATETRLDLRRDNVSVLPDGGIYLRRPGLAGDLPASQEKALDFFRRLPLDSRAEEIVRRANSFTQLRALTGVAEAQTQRATVVQQTAVPTVRAAPSTPARPSGPAATVLAGSAAVEPLARPVTSAPPPNRTPLVAVGVLAVVAIVVAAFFVTSSGGDEGREPEPTVAIGVVTSPGVVAPTTAPTVVVIVPTQPPVGAALPTREEVMQALSTSNQIYITAFRNGDINLLSTTFSGAALTYYRGEMNKMLAAGQRQDNAILQTDYVDVRIPSPTRAIVTTRERWSYRLVGQATAQQFTYLEYYEMDKTPEGWRVSVNTFERVP